MGSFLTFNWPFYGRSEEEIPIGSESGASLKLVLVRCKTVVNTWIRDGEDPRYPLRVGFDKPEGRDLPLN